MGRGAEQPGYGVKPSPLEGAFDPVLLGGSGKRAGDTQRVLVKPDRAGVFKLATPPVSHWLRAVLGTTYVFRHFQLSAGTGEAGSSSPDREVQVQPAGVRGRWG